MNGRIFNTTGSDFGVGAKRKDNEIYGEGNSYDFGARMYEPRLGRWPTLDILQPKYAGLSPYNFVANSPLRNIDPDGREIIVTNKGGKELFRLDDGKTKVTTLTSMELYKKGIQWFEPKADNYMPLVSVVDEIEKSSDLKHFTWEEIARFADEDRWMTSYVQKGSGDWKQSPEGADGYYLITVGQDIYWADAVGQIPFAVDYYTDELKKHGNSNIAMSLTIQKAKEYGEGKLFGGKVDNSNTYDNYFVLRAVKYASEKYKLGTKDFFGGFTITKTSYSPSNLGNRISSAPEICPAYNEGSSGEGAMKE